MDPDLLRPPPAELALAQFLERGAERLLLQHGRGSRDGGARVASVGFQHPQAVALGHVEQRARRRRVGDADGADAVGRHEREVALDLREVVALRPVGPRLERGGARTRRGTTRPRAAQQPRSAGATGGAGAAWTEEEAAPPGPALRKRKCPASSRHASDADLLQARGSIHGTTPDRTQRHDHAPAHRTAQRRIPSPAAVAERRRRSTSAGATWGPARGTSTWRSLRRISMRGHTSGRVARSEPTERRASERLATCRAGGQDQSCFQKWMRAPPLVEAMSSPSEL